MYGCSGKDDMKKRNYQRLIVVFVMCLLCSCVVIQANSDRALKAGYTADHPQIINTALQEPLQITEDTTKKALILYGDEEKDEKRLYNMDIVLDHMRFDYDTIRMDRCDSVSYKDYDLVIIASDQIQQMAAPVSGLLEYVKHGGRLFWGMIPSDTGAQFNSVYRKLGILDYGNYEEYQSITFVKDLIPGTKDETFEGESFTDVGISVTLEENAQVYVSAQYDNRNMPVVWSNDYGEGRVVFYNGTSLSGDYWRGFTAGCITALFDNLMYPIINASCIFIDDFPSPQYENTSDITQEQYNRTVKEFYRDIWWPDMQKVASKYDDKYVGLFIATYNDIVDPEDFEYDEPSMEQYYGNSLLKSGNEMGAHGYNHQSLTLEGGTPAYLDYNAWNSIADMKSALLELDSIRERLFPSVTFKTYVPPSNYLSAEGREAVRQAFPDLKVISGTLSNEGEEGEICRQDYSVDSDGIVDFPRITSGMILDDFGRFQLVNGMGLYGVMSHFIHPDDMFDEERSFGMTWEELYDGYCETMDWYHSTYSNIRSLTAVSAADTVIVYDSARPHIVYGEDEITGSIENMCGETYFYLHTTKTPYVVDDSCTIQQVDHGDYYMITAEKSNFRIGLRS